jgi:hypothetical protein
MAQRYGRLIVLLTVIIVITVAASPRVASSPGSGITVQYLNYPDIVRQLTRIAAEYPEIAQAVNLNERFQTPLTAEGRSLWALKVSDHVIRDEDEPVIVIDGGHHARELMTPLAVLDIANVLTSQYDLDPQVARWVNEYEIWLIPSVNPDGLVYVFSGFPNWRKNRRPNGDGTFGVDLNRNYPFGWGRCGQTSSQPASDVYRGPAPASEPEVQTLLALGQQKRPLIYLTYHSAGEEVLFPYRCARLAEPATYFAIRDRYAELMGYGMRLASASGESFEHFYNQFGSLAFLTEIGRSFQPPITEAAAVLMGLRPGWQYLFDRGLGASLAGHIVDAMTGEPVADATISLDGIMFSEGEVRRPEARFGRYHWIVQPGVYTVRVTAAGYESQARTVVVGDQPTVVDVRLERRSQ